MKFTNQYLVSEGDIKKREAFYNYMVSLGYSDVIYHKSKIHILNSSFPFIIEPHRKGISVLESITCCAFAQQFNMIISIDEFKKEMEQ